MPRYEVNWITDSLAAGWAPMSYEDLEAIRDQGINAIVNLCAEYGDLCEIERLSGFEVLHLPIEDGEAPDAEELEKALEWLDEAIYLGKKVLIHCRHGVGRTGTFVTSYLLRRGFGLKFAEKALKSIRSTPTSFSQWRLLKKIDKKTKRLSIREPSLQSRNLVDLSPYFAEYESLITELDQTVQTDQTIVEKIPGCGAEADACCSRVVPVHLIEAAYLTHHLNKGLTQEDRRGAIARAVAAQRLLSLPSEPSQKKRYVCPLSVNGRCIAYSYRPVVCRLCRSAKGGPKSVQTDDDDHTDADPCERTRIESIEYTLHEMSQQLFLALSSTFLEEEILTFQLHDVVSGKFIQDYFSFLKKKGLLGT